MVTGGRNVICQSHKALFRKFSNACLKAYEGRQGRKGKNKMNDEDSEKNETKQRTKYRKK